MPAGMAVTRHRHIDDIGLDLAQLVIAEAPFRQHPRAEILDHDIGDGDQPLDDLQAFDAADIQTEALFVDVGVVEISRGIQIDFEIMRRGGARQSAALVLRPLDFDDLGAKGAEPARRPWPRPHPAEIHDADVFQGSRTRHGVVAAAEARSGERGHRRVHSEYRSHHLIPLGSTIAAISGCWSTFSRVGVGAMIDTADQRFFSTAGGRFGDFGPSR